MASFIHIIIIWRGVIYCYKGEIFNAPLEHNIDNAKSYIVRYKNSRSPVLKIKKAGINGGCIETFYLFTTV